MVTPTEEAQFQDALDNLITRGTRNEIDIPSQYPFSTERVELHVNGNRQLPHPFVERVRTSLHAHNQE